tara:strand:- start:955 stop:1230 length:276 start_codon:yes stop_codon:yes gene_type:complete
MILPDGFIFGFIDNFLLLLGAYTGINIEKFFDNKSKGLFGGLIGAGVGHTFSNGLGAILDPSMNDMVLGIVIGTLIPLLSIPILEKIINRK